MLHWAPPAACAQRFRTWTILAYECGFKEDDIALQLTAACDSSRSVLPAALVRPCLEGVCIIWLTLEQSARPVARWAKGASVLARGCGSHACVSCACAHGFRSG